MDHLEQATSRQVWEHSPYFRIGETVSLPVYLVVAVDGTACIAPAEDWSIADPRDFYPCPGKWRLPRPS